MKRRNRAQTSSLFLLELILAILFFSLASAVCVQFFVHSHILSRKAQSLNHAVSECSGIAEIIYASDSMQDAEEVLLSAYPQADEKSEDSLNISYDHDFIPCGSKDGAYLLKTELTETEDMLNADIAMTDVESSDSIYELHITHHLQRRDRNGEE